MPEDGRLVAGRYRLQRRVGVGGMGEVWQALDEQLGRVVAVKPLASPPGSSAEEAARAKERAVREGRIAARLQHPGAVTVYDVADDDGRPVLVMEYVPGQNLAELIAGRGALPADEVARIGAQVAAALAAAHAAGIVHRDVKPANVLITGDGQAKITDFGIARARGDVTVTATGLLVGTPAFLAPEVARGAEPNPASDVFSLGATLYTALEGRAPFGDGDNPMAVLHAVAAGQSAPRVTDGSVGDLVEHLMGADPPLRPTMADAAQRLHALAAGHRPPAPTRVDLRPPPTADPPVRRGIGRGAVALIIATAVAAALTLLVLVLPNKPEQAATPSNTPNPTTAVIGPDDLNRAVTEYYGLLPENTGEAWTRLGPRMRAQGKEQYEQTWKDVKDLTISTAPRTTGANTVRVAIEYTAESRGRLRETRQLVLLARDGALLIDADEVLSSERVSGKDDKGRDNDKGKGKKEDEKKEDERKEGDG
ncbi:serine/threonine-protein kinase [Actinokineospora xionganensis]|uniref:non-specific serine/threonine protein kinase n=1 Tax=Actinokineospora xionganensis TaxID=2684470 RepID=A0ABR7LEX0_9PSEU|nr:serine/threonine-protein kinase [Actinokineospora xionganensis]MBC6451043.1 serine/threonine protein kinase [Actinokineospora xionganensis]